MAQDLPREVTVATRVFSQAREDFPAHRTDDGRPSYSDFRDGPLEAARLFFARRFDEAPTPEPGLPSIRQWDTLSKIFGPVFFYALAVAQRIEIISYEYDPDYWETIGDDPAEE